MPTISLEAQFADLQPWLATWAVDNEADRLATRAAADFAEVKALYEALAPRMDAIIEYLNATPMSAFHAAQRSLFHLAQSYFEAALSVELLHASDQPTMQPPEGIRIDIESGLR